LFKILPDKAAIKRGQKKACFHYAEREQARKWLNLCQEISESETRFSFLRTRFSFPFAKLQKKFRISKRIHRKKTEKFLCGHTY
jgi:hypothetical protein